MLDPRDPQFLADPYPTYARIREKGAVAVAMTQGPEACLVTGYEDCLRAFRDPRLKLPPSHRWATPQLGSGPAARILPGLLRFLDPHEPTRLRRIVSSACSPVAAQGLRPAVAALVGAALDRAEDKGAMDVVDDFAFPVAVLSAAELLGVPPEECSLLREWTPPAAAMLEPARLTPEGLERCDAAAEALWVYFEEHVRRLRASPGGDLLSSLIDGGSGDAPLSDEELVTFCLQHLIVGCRGSEAVIGSGALALATHPEQADLLRADPALAVGAVEECLRWDSPFQIATRIAAEDLCIRGFPVEAGRIVLIMLGAANRDPELFDDPDSFEIRRSGPPHLSFGSGPHAFVGASLTRVQAQLALRMLVRRFPRLRLGREGPVWRPSLLLRALERCPVVFAD